VPRFSFVRVALLGAFVSAIPSFIASACSPVEQVNPAPFDAGVEDGTNASVASSSSAGGQGSGGSGGSASSSGSGGSGASSSGSGGSGAGSSGSGASSGGSSASSSGSGGSGVGGGASSSGQGGGSNDAGVCPVTTLLVAVDPSPHVMACIPVTYSTNPPTSGPHYPYWAAFKWYDAPVPRGFLVHSMEHGAVIIYYHCETACEAELAELQAFLDARPADPLCMAPVKARIIVVPDPLIETRFAASAWGALLTSDCLDLVALGSFLDAHYAKGPENLCYNGVDILSPDAGTPVDCGSATDAGTDGG